MKNNPLSPEAKLVCLLARVDFDCDFQRKTEGLFRENEINPGIFSALCSYHHIITFAYNNLKKLNSRQIEKLLALLEQSYYLELSHTIYLENEFINLSKIFQEKNIEFIALKGIAFYKDIYPDLNFRSMRDIDILVHESDLEIIEDILTGAGYEKFLAGLTEDYWRHNHCHLMFRKNNILLEVHWDLAFKIPRKIKLPCLWERSKAVDINGLKIKALSLEDAVISLALHQRRFDSPFCLRSVCDLAELIKKYHSSINWEYLVETSKGNGILSCVYFIFLEAGIFLNTDILQDDMSKFKISKIRKYLIERVILRNTFSLKMISNADRKKEAYLFINFLLYDNIFEFLRYIIWIPHEKFAKYFGLKPYTKVSLLFFHIRAAYIPFKALINLGKKFKKLIFQAKIRNETNY